jgi:DNA helicase HerA-like ATPase
VSKKETKALINEINEKINNGKIPLGTIISPSGITDGYMLLRNENRKNPRLLKSLICFSMNDSPCLASIANVITQNPFMDFKSPLGMGNMSFIANRGKVPHTEDSDMRFAEVQFLTKLDDKCNREQLMTSPDIGLKVIEADDDVLETFYPFNFPDNIAVGRYLGRELAVPLDVFQLKTVHCGIFGETGWGKSVLQAFLAATLVRAGCKLLIFDHSGDYSNDNTDVNKIFSKLVGKRGKDFSVFIANEIRADHDLLRIKLKAVDFWYQIFQTTSDYAERLASEIVDRLEEQFSEVNDLRNVDGGRFFQFVLDAVPNTWSTQQAIQQKIRTANSKERKIKNWFETTIRPYIKRSISFEDVRTAILSQKAVVVDLSGENMDDSEKALYVSKIGDIVLAEGNRIYPGKKLNLVTVVDEAHIYVPQSVKDVEDPFWIKRSKKTIIEIAKQGRKYGLGLCLADQRITAVDKQAIDMGTYFLGKLKMAGDRGNIKEMFGRDEAEALRTIKKFQFLVIGNASPLENVTAPIAVFDPSKDLDYVAKIHS